MKTLGLSLSASVLIVLIACDAPTTDPAPAPPPNQPQTAGEVGGEPTPEVDLRWLPEQEAQRFAALEDQLGGFSEAMRRVNYRYLELYWAGTDRNWEYANYQLEKLASTMELGIIRRPGRAENARPFLDSSVPRLQAAIDAEDGEQFDEQFQAFTMHCNSCHVQEEVAFLEIAPPEYRATSLAPLSR